jgi:hypothetical protein
MHNGTLYKETGMMVDPGLTVFEIKGNARIPSWLGYLIKSHNLTRMAISKYALSVDAAIINRNS